MSPQHTCGNCRFRGEEICAGEFVGDPNAQATRFFPCELIKHYGSDFFHDVPGQEQRAAGAFVVDRSGYHAALCVAEDFGCNRWEEAKERHEIQN